LLADRLHPLKDRAHRFRFTLWTLLAIWVTATLAAGATYLIARSAEAGERDYRGQDYTRRACTHAPARSSLVDISGFGPLRADEAALVTPAESIRKPAVIYVWKDDSGCVARWSLDDG